MYSTTECEDCQSKNLELFDSGIEKNREWHAYKCEDCGHINTNEPTEE